MAVPNSNYSEILYSTFSFNELEGGENGPKLIAKLCSDVSILTLFKLFSLNVFEKIAFENDKQN
jgi:hypothetical protein